MNQSGACLHVAALVSNEKLGSMQLWGANLRVSAHLEERALNVDSRLLVSIAITLLLEKEEAVKLAWLVKVQALKRRGDHDRECLGVLSRDNNE